MTLSILEKLSASTISIRWSDPCLGHYESQIWGIGLSRADTTCALSGQPIRRGIRYFDRAPMDRMSPSIATG
ncbi:DUF3331 domain-containing protein [Paraburkholderia caribensis]|uniref:DUF3331 domain-containing protein n=1 Tax=Paraburkholderia caribensis TaxID=75105 RepID=UPI001D069DB9|nr:DUF3331 domain-containing protein [Paraburkholderia caribensis]